MTYTYNELHCRRFKFEITKLPTNTLYSIIHTHIIILYNYKLVMHICVYCIRDHYIYGIIRNELLCNNIHRMLILRRLFKTPTLTEILPTETIAYIATDMTS